MVCTLLNDQMGPRCSPATAHQWHTHPLHTWKQPQQGRRRLQSRAAHKGAHNCTRLCWQHRCTTQTMMLPGNSALDLDATTATSFGCQ